MQRGGTQRYAPHRTHFPRPPLCVLRADTNHRLRFMLRQKQNAHSMIKFTTATDTNDNRRLIRQRFLLEYSTKCTLIFARKSIREHDDRIRKSGRAGKRVE